MQRFGLEAKVPIRINSTCAVFAESEIVSLIARQKHKSEIVAGAHYAIAKRLSRMAKRVGAALIARDEHLKKAA